MNSKENSKVITSIIIVISVITALTITSVIAGG